MRLYTVAEVAERLNVKPSTVRKMFSEGELVGLAFRPGKRRRILRFREADLTALLTPPQAKAHD